MPRAQPLAAAPSGRGAAVGASPQGLEAFLTYRLHLLNKLTDRRTDARFVQELGLGLSGARCVAAVGHFGALSVNALAQRAHLDKSQASRAADSLVQRGWLVKTTPAHDQRGVELSLTPSGRALYRRVIRIAGERNEELFGCLSAQERATFSRLLARLIDAARTQADTAAAHWSPPP